MRGREEEQIRWWRWWQWWRWRARRRSAKLGPCVALGAWVDPDAVLCGCYLQRPRLQLSLVAGLVAVGLCAVVGILVVHQSSGALSAETLLQTVARIHRKGERLMMLDGHRAFFRCRNATSSAVHESGATPSLTASRHLRSTPQISLCRPVVRLPPNAAFFEAILW